MYVSPRVPSLSIQRLVSRFQLTSRFETLSALMEGELLSGYAHTHERPTIHTGISVQVQVQPVIFYLSADTTAVSIRHPRQRAVNRAPQRSTVRKICPADI